MKEPIRSMGAAQMFFSERAKEIKERMIKQ
jgi:hypothetical protein